MAYYPSLSQFYPSQHGMSKLINDVEKTEKYEPAPLIPVIAMELIKAIFKLTDVHGVVILHDDFIMLVERDTGTFTEDLPMLMHKYGFSKTYQIKTVANKPEKRMAKNGNLIKSPFLEDRFSYIEGTLGLYQGVYHLSEEVNVLRQRHMELYRNSVAFEGMFQCISEDIDNIKSNQLKEKLKLFIFLLAFLPYSDNDDYKHLARPERRNISCITVYLLGNDGAHSYNGNGILLATRRRYTRLTDEELLDEVQTANLPFNVLQRQPTDKEIARLSGKIGHEYRQLGFELGLKPAQLDHLLMDYQFAANRIERMLFIWRDDIEGNATFEILVKAMGMHGINPDIVSQSLERD